MDNDEIVAGQATARLTHEASRRSEIDGNGSYIVSVHGTGFFDSSVGIATNGYGGGDAGHGGYATISFGMTDSASVTVLEASAIDDGFFIRVKARGDAEITELLRMLRVAADELEYGLRTVSPRRSRYAPDYRT